MVMEEIFFLSSLLILKEKFSHTEFSPLCKNMDFLVQVPITLGISFHGLNTLMAIPW